MKLNREIFEQPRLFISHYRDGLVCHALHKAHALGWTIESRYMWCCAGGAVGGGGGGGGFWLQVCYTLVMEVGGRKVSAVFRVLFTPQSWWLMCHRCCLFVQYLGRWSQIMPPGRWTRQNSNVFRQRELWPLRAIFCQSHIHHQMFFFCCCLNWE